MRLIVLPLFRVVPIVLTIIGFGTLAPGQTVFIDFNASGQLTGNFNLWNDSGGANVGNYDFAESTSAGVNGSGGVSVFQSTDTTATYNGSGWDFSTNNAVVVVSTLIKANGQISA